MPPGASDSICYLPASLINHYVLIKRRMPLNAPTADTKGGTVSVCNVGHTFEDRRSCKVCEWIFIAFVFIDYFSPIYMKKRNKDWQQLSADAIFVSSLCLCGPNVTRNESTCAPCKVGLCLQTSGAGLIH